jgi:hypothetical protein
LTATAQKHEPLVDVEAVEAALRIIVGDNGSTELRVIDGATLDDRWPRVYSGYYDDFAKLARDAAEFTSAKGFYFVPNPFAAALLARSYNKIRSPGKEPTTADAEILQRKYLLIDLDATRPSGVSASDDEHAAALEKALAIRDYLTSLGWPMPLFADSGNGGHLLYRVDLPRDDGGLVKRILEKLAKQFDDERSTVDQKVFNPSRIWKLYGVMTGKGDPAAEALGRPQRRSKIIEVPEPWENVGRELLEALAGPAIEQPKASNGHASNGRFDFDLVAWIARNLPEARHKQTADGDVWILDPCPWNSQHTGGCAHIIRRANGKIGAACKHNSCAGNDWHSLRELFEPGHRERRNGSANGYRHHNQSEAPPDYEMPDFSSAPQPQAKPEPEAEKFNPMPIGVMADKFPKLLPPAINGLCRIGETVNLISTSKAGKSWLTDHLCLCFATGGMFLNTFQCQQGRVLLIDNELHPSVIAYRFATVAAAMEIQASDYRLLIDVVSLRGRLMNLHQLLAHLETKVEPGQYVASILDAWYRSQPAGTNENDNASIMGQYNAIDVVTSKLQCCWLNVHHASKGSQSDKSVVDVGSGAGAQSRAADAHIVLRPHEEEGAVVMDAALRSFPPIEPLPLRWEFPLWVPDTSLDATKLKTPLNRQELKQRQQDSEGITRIAVALKDGPATPSRLRELTVLSAARLNRLLGTLEKEGKVSKVPTVVRGNKTFLYSAVNLDPVDFERETHF